MQRIFGAIRAVEHHVRQRRACAIEAFAHGVHCGAHLGDYWSQCGAHHGSVPQQPRGAGEVAPGAGRLQRRLLLMALRATLHVCTAEWRAWHADRGTACLRGTVEGRPCVSRRILIAALVAHVKRRGYILPGLCHAPDQVARQLRPPTDGPQCYCGPQRGPVQDHGVLGITDHHLVAASRPEVFHVVGRHRGEPKSTGNPATIHLPRCFLQRRHASVDDEQLDYAGMVPGQVAGGDPANRAAIHGDPRGAAFD
mmetsp:Transcript_79119/g.219894  ORF Transcript_79119/g.219894 Transcript_79119/m.219894 type:complete len:253 (-) Transcript_79119:1201-1959(-)